MQPHWITFWNCSSRRPDGCLIKHFLCFMWRCSDFSSKGKLDGIFHLNHLWLKNKCPLWRTNMHVNSLPARVYLEFSAMLIHHLRVSSARFRCFLFCSELMSRLCTYPKWLQAPGSYHSEIRMEDMIDASLVSFPFTTTLVRDFCLV
jgi:hypothetical protein